MISSVGRRVGLLHCFRSSVSPGARICAVDCSLTAPAARFTGDFWLIPRCTSPDFVDKVLEICIREKISLVVPTIDTELPVYAANASRFRAEGVTVCISSPETVNIGADKTVTNSWLRQHRFPAVRQSSPGEVVRCRESWTLPVIAKPKGGSASIGVRLIGKWEDLETLAAADTDYVVEERATGREFTINVYVNRQGQCVAAVPHWRVEVRAGEVSKGVTTKDPRLVSLGKQIAEALPGAWGPLNIQCFLNSAGEIRVFEINARFGGGYPLAHHAGAKFTSWLLDEVEGRTVSPFDDWQDNLAMLRFDDAVYLPGSEIGLNGHA